MSAQGTHWDDCWRTHIDCAVKRVEDAEREAERLRQGLTAAASRLALARASMRSALRYSENDHLEAWLLAAKEGGWLEEVNAALADRGQADG